MSSSLVRWKCPHCSKFWHVWSAVKNKRLRCPACLEFSFGIVADLKQSKDGAENRAQQLSNPLFHTEFGPKIAGEIEQIEQRGD